MPRYGGIGIPVRRWQVLSALSLLACLLCYSIDLPAQGRVVAQEPVDIVILAARRLDLQIGSPGNIIDVVSFTVSGLPGSGPVQGVSSGGNPVAVRAHAVPGNQDMTLTADSSTPLNDGAGHTIPFTQIGWNGTGDVPSRSFTGSPRQLVFMTSRPARGTMPFFYLNTVYVPSGTYVGRVTYTLSSP